jgi:hypothetical protein
VHQRQYAAAGEAVLTQAHPQVEYQPANGALGQLVTG